MPASTRADSGTPSARRRPKSTAAPSKAPIPVPPRVGDPLPGGGYFWGHPSPMREAYLAGPDARVAALAKVLSDAAAELRRLFADRRVQRQLEHCYGADAATVRDAYRDAEAFADAASGYLSSYCFTHTTD